MGLYVSTTGTSVPLPELGTTVTHPSSDRDLGGQFTSLDIKNCESLTNAIRAGQLTWSKIPGGTTLPALDYDPDTLLSDEANLGNGLQDDRLVTFKDLDNLAVEVISLPRFAIPLLMNSGLSGGDWITYSELLPDSRILVPQKSILRDIVWCNRNTSVEFDMKFYKNGRTGTPYIIREVRSGALSYGAFYDQEDSFVRGDLLDIKYIDRGSNASDLSVILYFQTVP